METTISIIGITGENCAGKGAVGEYIESRFSDRNVLHVNTREEILSIAKSYDINLSDRPAVSKFSNDYTTQFGGQVYCGMFYGKAFAQKKDILIIDSVRRVDEVRYIKDKGGSIISVTAPSEQRFKWAQKRGTLTDQIKTLSDFIALDYKECAPQPWLLNLTETIKLADIHLENIYESKTAFMQSLEQRLRPFLLANISKRHFVEHAGAIAPGHGTC